MQNLEHLDPLGTMEFNQAIKLKKPLPEIDLAALSAILLDDALNTDLVIYRDGRRCELVVRRRHVDCEMLSDLLRFNP